MDRLERNPQGLVWRVGAAIAAPFLVASAYLLFTRLSRVGSTALSDYAGLAVSVFAGGVFVASLPIRPAFRVLSLLVYVPLLAVLLFFYTFWFIAVVWHEGL